MAMEIGAKSGVRSDINITPLVDVVLVLLIIFMVITPLLQRGKSVELPKARNAVTAKNAEGTPEPLILSVTADGKAYIESDKQPASPEQLVDAMKTALAENKKVMLKADVNTDYGAIRPVLEQASKAKLKGVQLAAEEIKEKK
ncbi:MAG TPA: biopolymer transporter ExbD [Myxococcales bacterium]|jgi:biopolymer transport protein ExbD|nr:biopolymer transporter ExbD [Myxococcales bacterium]